MKGRTNEGRCWWFEGGREKREAQHLGLLPPSRSTLYALITPTFLFSQTASLSGAQFPSELSEFMESFRFLAKEEGVLAQKSSEELSLNDPHFFDDLSSFPSQLPSSLPDHTSQNTRTSCPLPPPPPLLEKLLLPLPPSARNLRPRLQPPSSLPRFRQRRPSYVETSTEPRDLTSMLLWIRCCRTVCWRG